MQKAANNAIDIFTNDDIDIFTSISSLYNKTKYDMEKL